MPNYLIVENENPLNFVDLDEVLPDSYHFKHFSAWLESEQIIATEVGSPLAIQKWQNSDIIFLQVKSNYDPITVKIFNEELVEITALGTSMAVVGNVGDDIFLQAQFQLTTLPEGCYRVQILAGSPVQKTLQSEWLYVKQSHEGTLLLKYFHKSNTGILFQTGIYFLLRVDGTLKFKGWDRSRVIYIDTPNNSKTVKGKSARIFLLKLGNEAGCLPYIADKVEDAFNLNYFDADGKPFTAKPGAEMKEVPEDGYAWSGWEIELREANNRRGKRFESEGGLQEQKVLIDYIVEGKFFGPVVGDANDATYTINKME